MTAKKPAINATYCLHCTKTCKQPASAVQVSCPKRDYVTARQPDIRYHETEKE